MKIINVLIIEDDPMVADIHRKFILSVEGFNVVKIAYKGIDGLKALEEKDISLVVLDIFMPELDGKEILKKIREKRKDLDVIVVSAARDINIIKEVLRLGAFDYIVKPFKFERFKESLEAYKKYYKKLDNTVNEFSQKEIDNILNPRLKKTRKKILPKGIQIFTLEKIIDYMKETEIPLAADEVAYQLGISRVTVRRYLEYLVASNEALIEPCYQNIGRPINKYKLLK